MSELDSIFFESSTIQEFASVEARVAFRNRWLGMYLSSHPSEAFLALGDVDTVAGYLVGALADPSLDDRYASLGYFRDFAPLTALYPAHLHLNVASQHRSEGIGTLLVEAFAAHAARRGAPGMHIVTGLGMRNVGFYLRNGFAQVAQTDWNGRTVVMLARRLSTPPPP